LLSLLAPAAKDGIHAMARAALSLRPEMTSARHGPAHAGVPHEHDVPALLDLVLVGAAIMPRSQAPISPSARA